MIKPLSNEEIKEAVEQGGEDWDTAGGPRNELANFEHRAIAHKAGQEMLGQVVEKILDMAKNSAGFPEFHAEMVVFAMELKKQAEEKR